PQPKQPMPADAKLVFKGKIFEVYQWQQKMFDGSFETFERLKRSDTAVVVPITQEGEIMLIEEEQPGRPPFVTFPGGRKSGIEEDPLFAAKREFLEETGYASDDWMLWNAVQPTSKIDWAIYTFVARGCKKIGEQN